MSLTEMLDELPRLSFAERQELVQRATALDAEALTPDEETLLDERMRAFQRAPEAGFTLEEITSQLRRPLSDR